MYGPTATVLASREEFWQSVDAHERRFYQEGTHLADEYLTAFGIFGKVLAELRITDNSPKYYAAKRVVENRGKQIEFPF